MALIRNKVRQLPVSKEDFLTVLNREWQAVLGAAERLINARMGTVVTVTDSSYTVEAGVEVVLADSSGGVMTVTLPPASTTEMRITVKRVSATNNVNIQAGSGDSIYDGALALTANGKAVQCISAGGTVWYVVGDF